MDADAREQFQLSPSSSAAPDEYVSKLSTAESVAVAAYMTTIGIFSLVVNGFSLSTIAFKKETLKPTEYIIANINIADMSLVMSTFPFAVSSHVARRWLFGRTGCILYAFFSFVFGLTDLMAIIVAALARFAIICHSSKAKKYMTKSKMLLVILLAFLYSLFWSALPLGVWGSYGVEPFGTECTIDWASRENYSYLATISVTLYALPAAVLIYCYCRISQHVYTSARTLQLAYGGSATRWGSWSPSSPGRTHRQLQSTRHVYASKVGAFLCVSFFVCWTPYAVMSLWTPLFGLAPIPASLSVLPAMLAKASVACNPIFYLLMDRGFLKKLTCLRTRRIGASAPLINAKLTKDAAELFNLNGKSD